MSLPAPQERRLREIERELETDATLTALARQLGDGSQSRRLAIPLPRLGWVLAGLLSLVGAVVLAGGIASASRAGLILGIAFAVLFQGPLLSLTVARWQVRRRRGKR